MAFFVFVIPLSRVATTQTGGILCCVPGSARMVCPTPVCSRQAPFCPFLPRAKGAKQSASTHKPLASLASQKLNRRRSPLRSVDERPVSSSGVQYDSRPHGRPRAPTLVIHNPTALRDGGAQRSWISLKNLELDSARPPTALLLESSSSSSSRGPPRRTTGTLARLSSSPACALFKPRARRPLRVLGREANVNMAMAVPSTKAICPHRATLAF